MLYIISFLAARELTALITGHGHLRFLILGIWLLIGNVGVLNTLLVNLVALMCLHIWVNWVANNEWPLSVEIKVATIE